MSREPKGPTMGRWTRAAMLVAVIALLGQARPATAVIGGAPADPAPWTFLVPLLDAATTDPTSSFCSGSAIAPDWVLTAAHCVEGHPQGALQVATPGVPLSAILPADRIAVDRVHRYPYRFRGGVFADLALLHVTRPLPSTATLPQGLAYNDGFKFASVAGWGVSDPVTGARPAVLQAGNVTILSRAGCAASPVPGLLCATFPGSVESAACFGDSGGPLAGFVPGRPARLLAIVSFVTVPRGGGPICGAGRTTLYTGVARFRSWIVHVMRGLDPGTSMPELVDLRARDEGRTLAVDAEWCQTRARGHLLRVDIDVRTSRASLFRGVVRGRAQRGCVTAGIRRRDVYRPGRYKVFVKVKDQSTGMATPYPELLRGALTIVR
jgi:hypothetical protein